MSQAPNAWKDGTYWFGGALGLGAIGLMVGFASILGPGIGASGSGCGADCASTSKLFAVLGMLILAASFAAAATSVALVWEYRKPTSNGVVETLISIVNALIMLVSGACIVFLMSV